MVFLKIYVYIHYYKFLHYCDLGMLTSKQKSLEAEENIKTGRPRCLTLDIKEGAGGALGLLS